MLVKPLIAGLSPGPPAICETVSVQKAAGFLFFKNVLSGNDSGNSTANAPSCSPVPQSRARTRGNLIWLMFCRPLPESGSALFRRCLTRVFRADVDAQT